MSSPATTAFLTAWRNLTGRKPVTLCRIDIAAPSAVTLRVASTEVTTPDDNTWESGLKADPIRATVDFLGSGPNPADVTLRIANRTLAPLASGVLCDTASTWKWQGALVTIYLWERSLTSWSDALQVFQGTVDSYQPEDLWLTLNVLQPRAFNKPCPPKVIDKVNYPNAPDGQLGAPIPLIYGDFRALPMRAPHATPYGSKQDQEDMGGGRGVVPMLLVDPGLGAAKVKLVAAGHACKTIFDRSNGFSQFVAGTDVLAPLEASGLTATLGASESFLEINDDSLIAFYGIRGTDVRAAASSASNPRGAMDVLDETSFATLDQGAAKTRLQLVLPGSEGLGYVESAEFHICASGDPANTHQLQVKAYDVATSTASTSPVAGTLTSVTPILISGTLDTNFWNRPWRFSENSLHNQIDMRIEFAGGTINKAKIFWVGIRVRYRPDRSLITPASARTDILYPQRGGGFRQPRLPQIRTTQVTPAAYSVNGQFFANVQGQADDSSGTWAGATITLRNGQATLGNGRVDFGAPSGIEAIAAIPQIQVGDVLIDGGGFFTAGATVTAVNASPNSVTLSVGAGTSSTGPTVVLVIQQRNRLIERPPDIAHHLLATYGGVSGFETGASSFGSFVLARDLLRNATPADFRLACWMGEASSVQRLVQSVGEQSLCAFVIDPFSGNWMCHPWKQGARVDYDWLFTREDCPDLFDAGVTSDVEIVQGIRVQYAYDHYRSRTMFEAFVTASGSSQGYNLPTTRDQVLTIDATNDKLDWVTGFWGGGPFTFADTLTHATYAPIDLAAHLQSKFRTHVTAYYIASGHGFTVKAGYNDACEFGYGFSSYATTLRPGTYTADGLAIEFARAMNAAAGLSDVIKVTYLQSSNRFVLSSTGLFVAITALSTALNPATWAWWLLGFNGGTALASTRTAPYPMYADRFWVASEPTATINIKWLTGVNQAACCADVLGFVRADTALFNSFPALYARGNREAACLQSQNDYGARSDSIITADWIRDEASAQQLRDRRSDFGNTPRSWLRLRSHICPDLQRMRVIGLDATCDARRRYPGYGSDGSWAGKPMRVLETTLDLGPSYHTELYALDA